MPLQKKQPIPHEQATKLAKEEATGSSMERGLRVLTLLSSQGRSLTLAELSQSLGLPKATTHRLCNQLEHLGYLTRGAEERSFAVGPSLSRLALDTLNHSSLRGLRHQVLSDLVTAVGETCNYTTLDGAQVLYLDRVEAPWPWRLTLTVGAHVPLHCTASGKLFLAMMEPEQRELLLSGLSLQRLTPQTLTDAAALRIECEQIARQGYSLDREEFIAGLMAIAVPVLDAEQQVRAAVAVHAPSARMPVETALTLLPALQASASRISKFI